MKYSLRIILSLFFIMAFIFILIYSIIIKPSSVDKSISAIILILFGMFLLMRLRTYRMRQIYG